MSFQGLQERLSALQETTTQLRDLIDRLANLRFQPGSVPLDATEEESVSGELSVEIGQLLREGDEDAELLREEVEYMRPDGEEKSRLRDGVGRFRKARLAAKKSLAQAQRLERELVLQSYTQPSNPASPTIEPSDDANASQPGSPAPVLPQQQQQQRYRSNLHQQQQLSALSEEDKHTVGASTNVTNALRRTHELIASELERSEFARQTLEESSQALKSLSDSYGNLDDMLATSRKLLGTLVSSQKSNTWYLQTTFWMLVVTAGWLVFRRLLYGPAWWLVWLPLRVFFGVGSKAVSATVGKGKGKVGVAVTEEGRVKVDGIPGEDLPTVKVGKGDDVDVERGEDMDEIREKVEKIIEKAEEAEELGNIPEDGLEEIVVEEGQVRDEL
ncbi:hypothetical protein NLU13_3855 [Sarocladium strictum]|uniref:Sec20 C-terminal domain-containing protein n=1 Tax=Sarocladium strictum TaxID=5046 RepID=A0AA39GJH4_SARSR|nr:hypothetical protein NLU13_3855 [Sarocladium strictum]